MFLAQFSPEPWGPGGGGEPARPRSGGLFCLFHFRKLPFLCQHFPPPTDAVKLEVRLRLFLRPTNDPSVDAADIPLPSPGTAPLATSPPSPANPPRILQNGGTITTRPRRRSQSLQQPRSCPRRSRQRRPPSRPLSIPARKVSASSRHVIRRPRAQALAGKRPQKLAQRARGRLRTRNSAGVLQPWQRCAP